MRTFPTAGLSPIDVYNTAVRPSGYFEHVVTDDGTERHNIELVAVPTMASGGNYVNLNLVTTTAGAAATWVASLYAKVVQGSIKNVNGYFCAAELELVNSAANVSDNFVLVLNYQNNGAQRGSHESYIALRNYGSLAANSLFWFGEASLLGTVSATTLVSTSADKAATHLIRCMLPDGTVLRLLATTAAPS